MALAEHLYQFARIGVIFTRHEQAHIVFDSHSAYVADEGLIGGRVRADAPRVCPHLRVQPLLAQA
jgi:hypothetical protein